MATIHLYIGWSLMVAFLVLSVYGTVARLLRRDELGRPFWGVLYYAETVLVIQIVVGLILLLLGHRAGVGFDRHYLYGSIFPIIALIGGRMFTMRREEAEEPYPYIPVTFGAFVSFGLVTAAMNTVGALSF